MKAEEYEAAVVDESVATAVIKKGYYVTVDGVTHAAPTADELVKVLGFDGVGVQYEYLAIPTVNAKQVEAEALKLSGKTDAKELTNEDKARGLYALAYKAK